MMRNALEELEAEKELLTSRDEAKDIDGDESIGKENKSKHSSNNKEEKMVIAEQNNHRVTDELTSSIVENTKKEYSEVIRDFTQKECPVEDNGSIQIHQACKDGDKPTKRSCSNDNTYIAIDDSTLVKFRNNLFEAIEELRIQRTLDMENEERIKCLMTEKHELERKKEEEISKNNALVEKHAKQEIDIKKQQEDRLLRFEEEKAKKSIAAECTEKELKVLKDEVRALHLMKYNLEKKIKEQERLIQLQNSARDSHESQMSALGQRSKKAFDQCTLLADLVDKTETNISAASCLHRKLMYTNEHQKCLLESYKREMESKKFELVSLKATITQKKDSSMSNTADEVNRVNALERELRMQNEVCRQSQSQLDASRKENEKLMESLKEAHKLLDRHVQSINKHSELEAFAHLELDEIKTECQALKETLSKEKEEKQSVENTLKRNKVEWEEQTQSLESRLEILQKEYDSLSEAHNSLEQLNSNWSERNMEQKTKIESLLKEVDELKTRLTQAEEGIQSHQKMNEELKRTCGNETSSLSEQLLQAKQNCKNQTERAGSLENKCTVFKEKIEDLEQKISKTEKEQALKCKETTDASSQTVDSVCEISSFEQLLNAKQSCTKQMERADHLETQCTLLNGKVNNLMQKIAEKEKDEIKTKDTISTAVQTDLMAKKNLGQSENGDRCSYMNVNKDPHINEFLREESGHVQHKDENASTKNHTDFEEDVTGSIMPTVIKAIENVNQLNKECQLLRENEQSEPQLKVDAGADDDKKKTNNYKCGSLAGDSTTSNELTLTTTVCSSAKNKVTPQNILPRNNSSEVSINVDQYKKGNESENREDSMEVESGLTSREIRIPSKTFKILDNGEVANDGDNSETSTTSGNRQSMKENDTDNFITASKNISNQDKQATKKVRFNLDGTNTSSLVEAGTQPAKRKREINKEELSMIFSDEEDGETECGKIDEDVSQSISRIQNLLRSDRLRTNRKRKNTVAELKTD